MGEPQSLLPALADVIASLEQIFVVNPLSGVTVHNVNTCTKELRTLTTVTIGASKILLHKSAFGEVVPVLRESRAFSTGVMANIFDYGHVTVQYSPFMTEMRALGVVSPFFLVGGFAATNGVDFKSLVNVTARQVFSHINWDVDWRKQELVRGSALFGNERNCVGAFVRFNGTPDKVKSFRAFARMDLGPINLAALFKKGKALSGTMWLTGNVLEGCTLGLRLFGNNQKDVSARCSWRAAIGKCIVKGGFGIDGIVNSEISAKLIDGVRLTVATTLDHRLKDCTLGFDIMTETNPFADEE